MTNDKALEAAQAAYELHQDTAMDQQHSSVSAYIDALEGALLAMQERAEAAEAKWIAADEGEKLNAEFLAVADKRAEAAERERDEARLDRITAERDAQNMANQLVAAEVCVKELEEALAYAVKGLDMIHNGLMDHTRPRQAVGEVCAHFLSTALTGGSNG